MSHFICKVIIFQIENCSLVPGCCYTHPHSENLQNIFLILMEEYWTQMFSYLGWFLYPIKFSNT